MNIRKREKLERVEANIISNDNISKRKGDERLSDSKSEENYSNQLTLFYWVCLITCGFVLYNLAIRLQLSCEYENDFVFCPSTMEKVDSSADIVFNDSLARSHLKAISKLGDRPCGSTANEIHTPNYIINYLQKLKSLYIDKDNSNIAMIIDEQLASLNSFNIVIFKNHVTSIYDQIRNIVVRLHDTNNNYNLGQKTPAILFNCHYDSFFGGVGASDDLASCAVMLETIHSILKNQPMTLRFDLIFLFNGAEENMLQASHAFVSQHRFAKDVKLFVNLEAAGSGGRQLVFQTSKSNPWIISELGSVFRQPLASVIAQEIFSADLIPSDTDFRIFRDFGRVPGIDMAFVANGYVYHTRYDTEDRIAQPCLRHTGYNVLRLAVKLANSNNIAIYPEDEKFVQDSLLTSRQVVYFDVAGLALVSYTELTGLCVNIGLVAAGIIVLLVQSVNVDGYWRAVTRAAGSQLVWVGGNLALSLVLGLAVHRYGARMSWYAVRYNLIGLYLAPLIWFYIVYHHYVAPAICGKYPSQIASRHQASATILVLCVLTVLLTLWRLLSVYVIAVWLAFYLIDLLAHRVLDRADNASNIAYVTQDIACLSVPSIYLCYLVYVLYDVFIPILGRAGPTYPDVVVSGLTAFSIIVPGLVFSSAIHLTCSSTRKWMAFLLLHFTISYYIFVHCTQFGFPYNQSELAPRKQRIIIDHVTRNIRNDLGQTRLSESGIWLLSLDANQLGPLKAHLQPVLHEPMQEVFCELRPYCGYPIMYPFAKIIDHSLWLPQRPHQLQPPASIIVLSKITHISGMVNVTIQVSGPFRSGIYIMTPCSMRITSWSLGPDPPVPIQMPHSNPNYRHYYIIYAYGKKPAKPLKLWIMFMPRIDPMNTFPKDSSENQIELALGAHYLTTKTNELDAMLHLMPDWVVPTILASTYEHLVVDFDQNLSYVQ